MDTTKAYEYRKTHYSPKRSQCDMVLEYMELYGSITPLEALYAIGTIRLGARIFNLREAGYNISTEIRRSESDRTRYAVYRLEA